MTPLSIPDLISFAQRYGIGLVREVNGLLYLDREGQVPFELGSWSSGVWWNRIKKFAPITWYTDEMVFNGEWRRETIPASILGLARDMTIMRSPRESGAISRSGTAIGGYLLPGSVG